MEAYKHSCPYCGQHIEYTAGYCGRQMQCPICGQTITFPAIPPGRGAQSGSAKLKLKRPESKPAAKWSWNLPGMLLFLRGFQHWNVIAQCAVPFLIVGVLLAAAAYVKKNFSNTPAPAPAPAVQADPDAWRRMTDLARADQAVRDQLRLVLAARKQFALAERICKSAQTSGPMQRRGAEEQVKKAQCYWELECKRFDSVYANYQRLGGSVNYRSQLPN